MGPDEGDEPFDIIFNLAAETKYGQTDEVYEEKVFRLSEKVAKAAVEFGCKKFIEVSTAQVYAEGKKPSKEDAKLNPWTSLAKYKLKAEQSLKAMDGLPLVIVRPAIVYGPGDVSGISPRIITAAVYKHLNEKNKILEPIFGIKTGFFNSIMSNAAKLKLKMVTEEINDKHLKPWSDLCKDANILMTPLTPYIDQELLYSNALSIDGSAVESLGFSYKVPK